MALRDKDTIRFGVRSGDLRYSATWRLWGTQKGDAYLSARALAGTFKVSLHKDVWRTAFTKQSGATLPNTGNRAHREWPRPPEFAPGWTQGPSVLVPNLGLKEPFRISDGEDPENVVWHDLQPSGAKRLYTVLFSTPEGTSRGVRSVQAEADEVIGSFLLSTEETVWLSTRVAPFEPHERAPIDKLLEDLRYTPGPGGSRDDVKCLTLLWVTDSVGTPLMADLTLGKEYVGERGPPTAPAPTR